MKFDIILAISVFYGYHSVYSLDLAAGITEN